MSKSIKHPGIRLRAPADVGFTLANLVSEALRVAGIADTERKAFVKDAMSGDIAHMREVCASTVVVEFDT